MRDNFSCADLFLRPRDCGRVTLGDRFVIRRRRQSCAICRTDRQVLQETLGRFKLLDFRAFGFRPETYPFTGIAPPHLLRVNVPQSTA